jgi:hypothetical protein
VLAEEVARLVAGEDGDAVRQHGVDLAALEQKQAVAGLALARDVLARQEGRGGQALDQRQVHVGGQQGLRTAAGEPVGRPAEGGRESERVGECASA